MTAAKERGDVIRRAVRLIALLTAGPRTAADLAAELGLFPRTVYRYLRALNDVGVTIVAEGAPGLTMRYRIERETLRGLFGG